MQDRLAVCVSMFQTAVYVCCRWSSLSLWK